MLTTPLHRKVQSDEHCRTFIPDVWSEVKKIKVRINNFMFVICLVFLYKHLQFYIFLILLLQSEATVAAQ